MTSSFTLAEAGLVATSLAEASDSIASHLKAIFNVTQLKGVPFK